MRRLILSICVLLLALGAFLAVESLETRTSNLENLKNENALVQYHPDTDTFSLAAPTTVATMSWRPGGKELGKTLADDLLPCNICESLRSGRRHILIGKRIFLGQSVGSFNYKFFLKSTDGVFATGASHASANLYKKRDVFVTPSPFPWDDDDVPLDNTGIQVTAIECVGTAAILTLSVDLDLYPSNSTKYPWKNWFTGRQVVRNRVDTWAEALHLVDDHTVLLAPPGWDPPGPEREFYRKMFEKRCGPGSHARTIADMQSAVQVLPNGQELMSRWRELFPIDIQE